MTVRVAHPREGALLRLVAQRIAGPRATSRADAVGRLLAVRGQDSRGALRSVRRRTSGEKGGAVEGARDAGEVAGSGPMRGRRRLVPAEDLGWLMALCGPRVLAGAAKRRAALGLDEADAER